MIPSAYIQAWSAKAPWPDARQVEQDLIICRALCDLFNAPALKGKIAFRGRTAINKQLFKQPLRYSEDIDLVQTQAEPIGTTVDAIRAAFVTNSPSFEDEAECPPRGNDNPLQFTAAGLSIRPRLVRRARTTPNRKEKLRCE